MKFMKPDYSTAPWEFVRKFLDSLPAEFEILGPGQTAINGEWPKEYTRDVLAYLAEKIDVQIDAEHYWPGQSRALAAFAAIDAARGEGK